jgi:uncharacterized protein YjbI with pentapeptide repeats
LAAPLILIAVYCYFHLYLQRLWRCLASLPAIFPDGQALDDKAYPWLLNGLVRKHFKKLELDQRPLTRVENFVSILLAWWVLPFTLLAFWIRFLPRHDWWVTALHVALIAGAAWFGVYSYRLAVRTLRGEKRNRGDQPRLVRIWRTVRCNLTGGMAAAGFGGGIVVALSVDTATIEPGDDLLTALGSGLGYETYADLTDDDVSTKPSEWTGRDETATVEIAQIKGADLEDMDLRNADARGAFLAKAKLGGADLRGANLSEADLREVQLQDELMEDIVEAFSPAEVTFARAKHKADLRGALLTGANLAGANLGDADLRGAGLWRANLRGAGLRRADLRNAILDRADLKGAVLVYANLSDADLSGANLNGANLRGAKLRGAGLRGADLSGADLSGADGVTQEQLDEACGDNKTQLPEGLTIRTCPVAAPPASSLPPIGSS